MSPPVTATSHVVAVPYPGRGHINPLLNLLSSLSSTGNRRFTVILTSEWLSLLDLPVTSVQFATIPNVIPSEKVRGSDLLGFVEAVTTVMAAEVEAVLDRLEPPATVIVADTYLYWAVEMGNRRNIPVVSFWPMSATVFSVFYHFDVIQRHGHYPVPKGLEEAEDRIDYIPGVSSIRFMDLPDVLKANNEKILNFGLQAMSVIKHTRCLLFRSIYELEAPAIDVLKAKLSLPIYTVGPAIPHFKLIDVSTEPDYIQWLNSQPKSSVLYVSLGSFIPILSCQMEEIMAGLCASGTRYMWVARDEALKLKNDCDENGFVLPWCDQLRVLSHPSVGGFLSHCGWNSTLETVFSGVPVLTFPLVLDQPIDSKLGVEDWQIGWRVKMKMGMENMVKREEIARIVKPFMHLESDGRKHLDRRCKELQKKVMKAIDAGGSACIDLDTFSNTILVSSQMP